MPWVKIDERFDEHPRWDNAPAESVGLWVAAMAWCNRNDSLTGFIPATKTRGLLHCRNLKKTLTDLVDRGAFELADGGYLIHDYTDYQQNEKVRAIQQKRIEAGRLGARARWGQKPDPPPPNGIANAMAHANSNGENGMANGWQTDGNENAPKTEDRFGVTGNEDDELVDRDAMSSSSSDFEDAITLYVDLVAQRPRNAGKDRTWREGVESNCRRERTEGITALLALGYAPKEIADHLADGKPIRPPAAERPGHPADCQCEGTEWVYIDATPGDRRGSYGIRCPGLGAPLPEVRPGVRHLSVVEEESA